MRLLTLQLLPRGVTGWGSPLLRFGDRTTSLYAKNGSGKTPVIHALAFCLGYPVSFRKDIRDKCEAAVLTIEQSGKKIVLTRFIGESFAARVSYADEVAADYFSEGEYSDAMFQLLGLELPFLVSTSKEATRPYLSTVLPIFYLNQDNGYAEAYRSPRSFISDQFVEMVRFVFGLAPRHSFLEKRDLLQAKEELARLTDRIVAQQKRVQNRASTVDEANEGIEALNDKIEGLKGQLIRLRDGLATKGGARSALEELLGTKDDALRITRRSIDYLRDRLRGIETIRSEIDAELITLSLNEEAKRVFESFSEICQTPGCGLFIGSSQSYAKNLLYLKDQLKDLARNEQAAKIRLADLEDVLRQQESERTEIASKASTSGADDEADRVLSAIRQVTIALYNAEQRKADFEILADERTTYYRLEAERDRIQDRIATLTRTGHSDIQFNKLRLALRSSIVKWLDILETRNVSRDVDIDLDFRMTFGGERVEQIAGSTKIRVVLAIHAALFEEYLKDPRRPFRFLILDTPKQQEIQRLDLANYLVALSELAGELRGQVVFSTTEYKFPCSDADAEWVPTYSGGAQSMYLGPMN